MLAILRDLVWRYKRQLSLIELSAVALYFASEVFSLLVAFKSVSLPATSSLTRLLDVSPVPFSFFAMEYFLSGPGLVPFTLLFMEILCLILLDATPLVLYLQAPFLLGRKRGAEERDSGDAGDLQVSYTLADSTSDYLSSLVQRASDTARAAERRAIALIFVGTLVAGAGLVFFVATLPLALDGDISNRLLYIVPRVLMLLFIQLLAGFFLRQYRNSIEEFRFYEALLRRRESEMMFYRMYEDNPDENLRIKLIEHILKDANPGRLTKDETTVAIETQRLSNNEFTTLVDQVADILKNRSG